jgi:D-beta-D-heptose 7-phosphate kinase/D-beta-D-heptose 1-phosphate adenosyltransferase
MIKNLPQLLKKIARRRILVIGDVMLDHYQWGDATRISPEAPVPVVHVAKETDTIGGAANVAGNVAALGGSVEIVGAIGRDANGDKLRARFQEKGIVFDDRFMLDKGQGRTITKTRIIVQNQQLCRLDFEDAPGVYRGIHSPVNLDLIESKIREADAVILSDYAKGVLTRGSIGRFAAMAKKCGKIVALDPKPASAGQFRNLDLVTPNLKEALELSGLYFGSDEGIDYQKICDVIWKKYRTGNLVVTLGADGMLISRDGGAAKIIPTAARQVYDVSGAGDTVIAALTLALASGSSLEQAAHFANAAAGVVVGKRGTATVTPEELASYVAHGS